MKPHPARTALTFQVRLDCWHFVYLGPSMDEQPPLGGAWCPACQKHRAILSAIRLAEW